MMTDSVLRRWGENSRLIELVISVKPGFHPLYVQLWGIHYMSQISIPQSDIKPLPDRSFMP